MIAEDLRKIEQDLDCGDCGHPMRLVRSRRDGSLFYGCVRYPACRGTHGAHADGSPKGTPGDKPTRTARIRAHAAFDALWKTAETIYERYSTGPDGDVEVEFLRRVARSRAYSWLASQMGIKPGDCHIASFSVEQCREVERLVDGMTPAEIRAWAKARKKRLEAEKIERRAERERAAAERRERKRKEKQRAKESRETTREMRRRFKKPWEQLSLVSDDE